MSDPEVADVLRRAADQIRRGVSDNPPPVLPPLPRGPVKWVFEIIRVDGLIASVVATQEVAQ